MTEPTLHALLTRISRLLQAEDRAASPGLPPVQLHALDYLSRCNRYSDRPAAVAEYLGITKGTASQSLRVLMEAGLIEKHTNPDDRRSVHLLVTDEGRDVVAASGSKVLLDKALAELPSETSASLGEGLRDLLRAMQRANAGRSFGVCRTCRHFQTSDGSDFSEDAYRCGLTQEALSAADSSLICREHETRIEASTRAEP